MRKAQTWQDVFKRVNICEHGLHCNQCCWLWPGAKDSSGYGNVGMNGKDYITHRAIYIGYHGVTLTPSQLCLHTCDVKLCCNWWHLYIGDKRQNTKDALQRGQHKKGSSHVFAKLNENQVRQARRLYSSDSWSVEDLCNIFPVKKSVMGRIVHYKDWSHLIGEYRAISM